MNPAIGAALLGSAPTTPAAWTIERADDARTISAYRRLRHQVFVQEQRLFDRTDADPVDDDPRAIILVARGRDGTVLGGVRLAPVLPGPDLGWWSGGRLAVAAPARRAVGTDSIGSALIRAACAQAEQVGALRFEASVRASNEQFFRRLGWQRLHSLHIACVPHVQMRWPIGRFASLTQAVKAPLGALLAGLHLGGPGFIGDDGVPVPGSDLIAACDAIVPSLVERDPEWAGWCAVLVNVNDLSAMGAEPIGLLDAVGARDASFAARILAGLKAASQAYGVPILGGHTQFGVPAALSVTALGRTAHPIPGGGGEPGHAISLTADLDGRWRRGHTGQQWDSSTHRSAEQLRALSGIVARNSPAAAKDVSMAGTVGTLGMLAEASGCGAVLEVAAVPKPTTAGMGDWLTCFPGYAMLTADEPGRPIIDYGPATTAVCGHLTRGSGVALRWPDGQLTEAIRGGVTGLGAAHDLNPARDGERDT